MADTDFDDFTLVTALQTTDLFLALRGSGGINFTLATLASEAMKQAGNGTVSLPGIAFASDPNTGLYRPAADTIGIVTGGVDRIRIDSVGRVGIGTTTPADLVDVRSATAPVLSARVEAGGATAYPSILKLIGSNSTGSVSQEAHLVAYQPAGGAASEAALDVRVRNSGDSFGSPSTVMTFRNGNRVGVNTNNPLAALAVQGEAIIGDAANLSSITGGTPARLAVAWSVPSGMSWTANATTEFLVSRPGGLGMTLLTDSAGTCAIKFADESSETAGVLQYEHSSDRFNFQIGGSNKLLIAGTAVFPGVDNSLSLGTSGLRWSVVYAATGTINTSDEREKLWIERGEDRSDLDRRISRRILDELGWFQWRNAVAEKGEAGARWHFGARAQRVWSIVADEGLCAPIIDDEAFGMIPDPTWPGPPPPAWLCYDIWDDEYEDEWETVTVVKQREVTRELTGLFDVRGNPAMVTEMADYEEEETVKTGRQLVRLAGNRFGFRLDQIGLLLDWSLHDRQEEQAARQDALDARLAALEAAAA